MRDIIVVDTEIQNLIMRESDWEHPENMGLACGVVYEFQTDRYRIFGPAKHSELAMRLTFAEWIISFNGVRFDYGLIFRCAANEVSKEIINKSTDILRVIWQELKLNPDIFDKITHGGWSLGMICGYCLGVGKINSGENAPRLYQQGRFDELHTYCCDDVSLTRDLFNFIRKNKFAATKQKKVNFSDATISKHFDIL